jgi:hypothetical protein
MFQFTGCPQPFGRAVETAGCPIRRSPAQCLLAAPRSLSERCPVLHRHAAPGHPSCAHSVFPPPPSAALARGGGWGREARRANGAPVFSIRIASVGKVRRWLRPAVGVKKRCRPKALPRLRHSSVGPERASGEAVLSLYRNSVSLPRLQRPVKSLVLSCRSRLTARSIARVTEPVKSHRIIGCGTVHRGGYT